MKGESMGTGMIRWAGVLLAVCVCTAGACVKADTLSYRHGTPGQIGDEVPNPGTALGQIPAAVEAPANLTALPPLSESVQFLTVSLGEGPQTYLAVFDSEANSRRGAFYFDLNGDGNLAEEKPVQPYALRGTYYYGPISVALTRGGRIGPYHFCIRRYPGGAGKDYWSLTPCCYNVGDVTIGNKAYRLAVTDGAANGVFNDVWDQSKRWSDHAYVDWDGDGKFGSGDSLYCTKRYLRDGQWYDVSFSPDGLEVTFTPAQFPMGTVKFGDFSLTAQFVSSTGQGGFIASGFGQIDVPADEYGVLRCWIKTLDAEGNAWEASGSTSPAAKVVVREDADVTLTIGPPFAAVLTAASKPPHRRGGNILFNVKVGDAGGKDYTFRRDGLQMRAPRMLFRDEFGRQVGSCAFSYG